MKSEVIKCIIWDLDNTLWEGILSENDNITLKEDIKEILIEVDKRGIINSIASKNTYEDAMRQLKLFELDEYFLYPQINWNNKSESVKVIVEKLNIGYDSIAFIDDQDFERDEVKFIHKDVNCYNEKIIPLLLKRSEFMPRFITEESPKRRKMYLLDEIRNKEELKIGNSVAFMESLGMEFKIIPAKIDDLKRAEELTIRTNQLNSTGYTYSYEELEYFIASPDYLLFVSELVDKYGSYGKIGLVLIKKNNDVWDIKLLLMSCRVMSRGVGTILMHYIMNLALENQVSLYADFLQTPRNRIMYITYKFAGFTEVCKTNNRIKLKSNLKEYKKYPDFIKVNHK